MSTWRFYIETFGCKVNQHESQLLREAWSNAGGEETFFAQEASLVCVNSCAITSRAERDARNAIYRLKKLAPNARIIFTGCAAQLYKDANASAGMNFPEVRIVPQREKGSLLADPMQEDGRSELSGASGIIHDFQRSRPVVKVQDGCRQNCAFCIVPQTRGRPTSRAFSEILKECRGLLKAGFPEIVISGINLRHYEIPDGGGNFWDMLKALDASLLPEFVGKARLRVSSLEPSMLGAQALDALASSRMLAPHLHISLQHASLKILTLMGRKDTIPEKISDFLGELAKLWPLAGIGADILVGFPGERLDDLEILAEYLNEIQLSYAHVFPFSPRPGTRAALFDGQLDQREKSRRAAHIRRLIAAKHEIFLERQLGLAQFGLVLDQPVAGEKVLKGRNDYYAPCFMDIGSYARNIITVRPKGRFMNGLLVEPFENKTPAHESRGGKFMPQPE